MSTVVRRVLVVSLGLWLFVGLAESDVSAYVAHALDVIEREALFTDAVDWPLQRASVLERASDAREMDVAYELIEETLVLLGDGHSFLRRPSSGTSPSAGGVTSGALGGYAGASLHGDTLTVLSVHPGSPAELAGLVRGDRIVRVGEVAVTPGNARELQEVAGQVGTRLLVLAATGETRDVQTDELEFNTGLPPTAYWFSDRIAVLDLPQHAGSGVVAGVGNYAELGHQAVEDHAGACGWIVDLRLNYGGNMWPMLAAAGPLLGEG